MNNYSKTYSVWYMTRFWKTKALLNGAQTVLAAITLIAMVFLSGFQPLT